MVSRLRSWRRRGGLRGEAEAGAAAPGERGADVELITPAVAAALPAHQGAAVSRARKVARVIERVEERGIEVRLTEAARTLLGNLGYDPTYGARPLKRVIQHRIENPLANRILKGEFGEGDTIRVDVDKARRDFTFSKSREAVEAELVS